MHLRTLAQQWPGIDEHRRHLVLALAIGVAYWLLASYSLALPVRASGISYIWPADGLALGALLCTRIRNWPYYLAAVFLANFLASNKPLALNLLYSSFNVFEPWLVAGVVTKVLGVRPHIASLLAAVRLMLLTAAVMALAILITNTIDWLIHRGDFWRTWVIWYLSNTLGMLIIAPLVLALANELRAELGRLSRGQYIEAAVLLGGLVVSTQMVYSAAPGQVDRWVPLSTTPLLVPTIFMLWGAVRFALPGGTVCVAILTMLSIWYTANGLGPYAALHTDSRAALVHLQATLVVAVFLVIVVSAVATEWRHALADSRASKKRLERALDSARLALFEIDVAGGRVYLSEGWAEMIGAEPGETHTTVGELLETVHADDRQEAWKIAMEALSGKRDSYDVEHRVRRRDGGWIWILSRCRIVERDAAGRTLRMAGTNVEITARKRTEQRAHYLATRDTLTDLGNRALFGDSLQEAVADAARAGGRVALISAGLDRFTEINDSLGQPVGDVILQDIAGRLKAVVGRDCTVARPGGDEFLVLMPDIKSADEASGCAQGVLAEISKPVSVDGRELFVTASLGVALFPNDGDSAGSLLRNADIALHHAKRGGGDRIQFFAEPMNVAARSRMEIETAMRLGLDRDEFIVYFQPQVTMATGRLIGFEALVRWRHPQRGLVSPLDFVPVAESTGLIVALGEKVLSSACRQAALWQGRAQAPVRVAVNVSARQFRGRGFVDSVATVLASTGLDPRLLELEIIENTLMEQGADTVATLGALRNMGVQLAIDDFGTGYSSLSYLRHLPIDTIKIDQSFVADLPGSRDAGAIAGAIIALAHNLGLQVLAEGVETRAQFDYLRDHGCDHVQGFFIGRPQPPESLFTQPESREKDSAVMAAPVDSSDTR